jgi:hypothetical protein
MAATTILRMRTVYPLRTSSLTRLVSLVNRHAQQIRITRPTLQDGDPIRQMDNRCHLISVGYRLKLCAERMEDAHCHPRIG